MYIRIQAPLAGSRGRDTLQPAALRRQGLIADWHDGQIEAGNSWKTQIAHQMSTAQIIPLLISADFIDSYFCCEVEMRRAPERHESVEARVIPIILPPLRLGGDAVRVLPSPDADCQAGNSVEDAGRCVLCSRCQHKENGSKMA